MSAVCLHFCCNSVFFNLHGIRDKYQLFVYVFVISAVCLHFCCNSVFDLHGIRDEYQLFVYFYLIANCLFTFLLLFSCLFTWYQGRISAVCLHFCCNLVVYLHGICDEYQLFVYFYMIANCLFTFLLAFTTLQVSAVCLLF